MKHYTTYTLNPFWKFVKQKFLVILLFVLALLFNSDVKAVVAITKVGGGTNLSADKASNAIVPAYTTLGDLVITEGAVNDFAIGTGVTFTLNAPAGWTFNTSASVTAIASAGKDISSAAVISVTSSLITIQLTVSGNIKSDVLTVSGIEVQANDGGNIPASANITKGGSVVITGCAAGANLGSLSQIAGAVSQLLITLPGQSFADANTFASSGNSGSANTQTAGTSFLITKIRACDQFYNVVTGYFGVKTLIYSGPSNGLTAPSYVTSVSFASGISSTALTTTLKKAETTTITVSDGTITGSASSPITVGTGACSNFLIESASGGNIGTQVTGISFNIKITARDANNNFCTAGPNTFNGTVDITSSGTLASGGGTTASFTSGILSSHALSISNQGNFTLTATKTGSSESGVSNAFSVNYPPSNITLISPSCITPGGSAFVLTVDGNNLTGASTVRFNGSDRPTTFINANELTANIPASDISSPAVYSITVYTPGSGTTAPLILNMNTASTVNDTICQGSTYILPDGSSQNTTGTYITHIPNASGCDSIITTNLVVNASPSRTENISICPGSTYVLPDGSTQSSPGTYISTIPNPPGCDSIITTIITLYQSPVLTATPVQIDCFGGRGSVLLNAGNGLAPYSFGPTPTTNLISGTYNYSVTDANGCIDNTSAVIDPQPSQLILTATPNQISCFGGAGSVILNTSGGTPSYSYGITPTTNLASGIYNYQVTDNNGCIANASTVINAAPAALTAVTSVVNTPCGSSVGTATITVSGGVSPYSYSWNTTPVSSARTISGLSTGNYTVTATDNNGCTISKTATIINTNFTSVSISGTTGICPGGNTTLCATTGFVSYLWSTGETTQCISVNTIDTFNVTVTNLQGCSLNKSIVTHDGTIPAFSITGGTLCLNSTLMLRAPVGYPYYLWSNGAKTYYSAVRSPGTYSVTLKNADNCASTSSFTVNSPLRITGTKIDAKCSNEFKGSATVTASSGVLPYTYLWNNGDTTSSISGLDPGNYTVRVVDSGGCALVYTANIASNKTSGDYSAASSSFNNNTISAGSYIWFSAAVNINFTGTYPVTINFTNQNISGGGLNLLPANAKLIITNAASQATTTFTGGEWVTTAPPNLSGNYFISGYAYPVSAQMAANLTSIKWKGIWASSSSCVTGVQWKWAAAVYSNISTDNTLIDVKPVDDNLTSIYLNSDNAGTPENYKSNCIAGANSNGGTDYTGSYSAIANRIPCAAPDVCTSFLRLLGNRTVDEIESNTIADAYPNPFNSSTNIEFVKLDKSAHLFIEIYSLFGQKLKTIFDNDIDPGIVYTVEFDAGDLSDGIYIYRLVTGDEEVKGKLILRK